MEPTRNPRSEQRHDLNHEPDHDQRRRADRSNRGDGQPVSKLQRFAAEYGWWRVVAIPVMTVITVWMLVDVVSGSDDIDTTAADETQSGSEGTDANGDAGHSDGDNGEGLTGPDPAHAEAMALAAEQLPPGGAFTESGDGTFRVAGQSGLEVGEGKEKTIRYTVEIENGVDTTAYGGDSAFAAMVDATLSDPRGWTNDPQFKFVHVGADEEVDTRIRLTSLATTAELCGDVLALETSCHTTVTGESTVILNESRWVRGAKPYEGDLGNYRQYLINHEVGHAIGYAAHQPCGGEGKLAPIMMQQTIELNNAKIAELSPYDVYNGQDDVTCEPNPWPYPTAATTDIHDPQSG